MKKLTLFLVAMTMSLLSFAAQPKRIYAYNLSATSSGEVYTFSFTANETPTSGRILFYDATTGDFVGEKALTDAKLGENQVQISQYDLPGNDGQQLNWAVELSAAAVTAYEKIFADASHQYRRGFSNVDISPESDYFGTVYVTDWCKTKTNSKIYVYNPVYSKSATGYNPGSPSAGWGCSRFTIAPNGNLWLTDYSDGHSGLFLVDPADLTKATQFFAGTRESSGLIKNGDVEVGSSLSCATLYGTGANTKLVTVAEDYTGKSFPVAVFNVGQEDGSLATSWTTAPNILFNTLGNAAQIFDVKACEKGVWVATNRGTGSNNSGATSLRFYTWDGICTWSSHEHTDIINGNLGGGIAITPDEKQIVMKIHGNNIAVFDITWNEDTPTLTTNATFNCGYAAVSAINLDYAGNIVTVAGTNFGNTDDQRMSLVVYSNPTTNNTCEVPAKKASLVTKKWKTAPRAWAYDLKVVEDGDNYKFNFTTTAAGNATISFNDKDGNKLYESHNAGHVEAGPQEVTISKSYFTENKNVYWAVKITGEAIPMVAEITDQSRGIYDFYNMMGVVVDNDPNSDYFGKIYIQQSYEYPGSGNTAERNKTQKAGIFIYDQGLNELNNPANTGIQPQLPYALGGNRQTFKRIAINPANGNIAFCNNKTDNGGAYSVSRADLTSEAVNLTKDIADIKNVNALCYDKDGNLYVVANVVTNYTNGDIYKIADDGTYTKLTPLRPDGKKIWVNEEIAVVSDGRGGIWVAQTRDDIDQYSALFHVNFDESKVDFVLEKGQGYSDWFETKNRRGAIAYDTQRNILAVHGPSAASLFSVEYDAEGVPSITKFLQTPNIGSANIDGLAFDYAGDLYLVSSGTEKFYKYTLPTKDNTCTTPAPKTQALELENYTMTLNTNDENKGTVSGAGEYKVGETATITATPEEGYKLLYWSDRSTENPRNITMTKNEALSAYFVKEYAVEPTFTIEKVWENAQVPAATADGYQAVGWDQKIYMQNKTAGKIQVFSNGTDAIVDYATSGTGQQIAIDEAGNLIVFNAYFATSTPNSILIYKKGEATGTAVSFTLQDPARCDFFSASGDIYSPDGGYVYFYCAGKTVINRLKITNGAATTSDVTTDVVGESVYSSPQNTNYVMVDIFGNLVAHARSNAINAINIYTNETKTFSLKNIKMGTLGGCSFELGGKELWAYHAGATNYSSEWNLYNMTDGKFLSDTILYAVDKTNSANNACNWLNVQVVDEKTAYIYQFCPKKAVALWKVTMKETFTVAASANTAEWGTVAGAGQYLEGTTATLTATPNTGYKFVNWTKGGEVVSTDATYSFPVTENVELVANFEAITSKDPRAWAYDMKLGEEGDNYTFTFKATTAGQATISFKDKDGNALTQPESQTMEAAAGEDNKFTIAKNAFAEGVDAFWSITMDGAPIEGVVEVTDQSRGIYDFYNMMGVVVDNNTDSKDFGKIYVQASLNGKSGGITDRAKAQKAGIFVYNQVLDELNDPSNTGYKPTVPSEYTEIGSSSSAFQRLNIHPKTGNLVYSHAIDGKPAVFAINREDMTGAVTNLLTGVADMTRSVAHCFDAEGMLYVMDFAEEEGTVYKVINGEATPFTATSDKFINAYITIVSDGRGGLWISQNRGQFDAEPYPAFYQLAHVTSTGEFDWVVNRDTPHGFVGSSYRGALAYDVERKILAQGRNGKVELYTVSYEPTITLTPLYTIASDDLGNNIDGLAFDYAGDLYVVNSSKEKFQKFTLPTAENICTAAAPALEAIRFTPVYTVSVASNNNEWGIANGGGTFEEGETATITAVAATNYEFVNWTKEGAEVSTENSYTFAVTETATYIANFKEITKYTINATANDGEMGSVTGGGDYYEGSTVTLTATANGGYVFVDWSDGNTEETRTIEVTSDLNLTANFKVTVPRAWAYDLRKGEDGENYTFTFKTTSAGTATLIFKDKDGNTLDFGAHTATATEAGEQTITIAKTVFAAATKDIYWSVELAGEAITKMAEITDPAREIYDFYSTLGVVVDNNPESEYFGKIYVQATLNGASDGATTRAKEQTAGLFIYNQLLDELNPISNVGIQPSLPSGYSIGDTYQFNRLAIDPTTNNITYCYAVKNQPAVFSMDRANLTGTPINLLAEQTGITRSVAHCFDQEGNLYVMDLPGSGQIFKIEKNGTKSAFGESTDKYVQVNTSLASDGLGGLWVSQNRGQIDAYYQLVHYNASGTVDFAVYQGNENGFTGGSYRGALAYDINRQILAQGRDAAVELFNVTYDETTGVPTLTKFATTPTLSGANIDGLAFDYAGDLYMVNSGTERFYKYVLPTDNNTCTVPAPESQFIQKEARYTVTVAVNDNAMGTATGGGEYKAGEIITLTATANPGYRFINWTNGYGSEQVSTEDAYSFTVTGDIILTANFEPLPEIAYELNGGVWNKYGWESKGDICLALEADYNATYGTSKDWVQEVDGEIQYNINGTWMSEEEAKGQAATVTGFLQASTYNTTDNLKNLVETTMVDKYGWLKDVIEANRTAQSVAGELSEAIYRKELSAFFLCSPAHSSWPASSSHEAMGDVAAFQSYWGQTFPNPTQPTTTIELGNPYREGHDFGGWYAESDFSGVPVTTVDENTTGTFYAKWNLVIDENADNNSTVLASYEGESVTVTVKRNFESNKCYTLTLPFGMNASQIENVFGNATVYEFYNIVEKGSEELYLEFIPTSSIQAGKPCLIVTPSGSFDANDGFTVEDVIISTTSQPVQVGSVTMMPVLDNGHEMTSPDEYYVWNGGLYCAGTYSMTSKGLRAYFVSSSPLPVRARVVLQDNEATSIPLVGVGQDDQVRKIMKDGQIIIIRGEEQYNIQGQTID